METVDDCGENECARTIARKCAFTTEQTRRTTSCPLFLTVQTSAAASGRETTSSTGRFSVYGVIQVMPYDVAAEGRTQNSVLPNFKSNVGIASLNHTESALGEDCMDGEGLSADVDMDLFPSVAIVNAED